MSIKADSQQWCKIKEAQKDPYFWHNSKELRDVQKKVFSETNFNHNEHANQLNSDQGSVVGKH